MLDNVISVIQPNILPCLIAFYLGYGGYRKKSLNLSGAISAIFVGFVAVRYGGLFETLVLLFFFYSSSKLTKYKSDVKKLREDGFQGGEGHRNWEQVLANGGFPTVLLLVRQLLLVSSSAAGSDGGSSHNHSFMFQHLLPGLLSGDSWSNSEVMMPKWVFILWTYIGVYCANCADTWSSEVGILSQTEPRFILAPWRTVPYGTNGGVSAKGLWAAILCGLSYGVLITWYIAIELLIRTLFLTQGKDSTVTIITSLFKTDDALQQLMSHNKRVILVIFGLTIGASMLGTLFDSVAGALFEYSGFSRSRNKVVKEYSEKEDREGDLIHISGLNILNGCQINFLSGVVTGVCTGVAALYIL